MLVPAAACVAAVLLLAPAEQAQAPSPAPPAVAPTQVAAPAAAPAAPTQVAAPAMSPMVAAAQAARARAAARAPGGATWTLATLEALDKRERPTSLNVVSTPDGGGIVVVSTAGRSGPGGINERYQEMLAQANAELAKLDRERLAASNPLLRGVVESPPRSTAEIGLDTVKWQTRRETATRALGLLP